MRIGGRLPDSGATQIQIRIALNWGAVARQRPGGTADPGTLAPCGEIRPVRRTAHLE